MKLCDEKIQKHLLNGGEIKRNDDEFWFNLRHIKLIDDVLRFTDDENEPYEITRGDLLANDWEIVEPEYDWDKIIKDKILCQFYDEIKDKNDPCIGLLEKKTEKGFYKKDWDCFWKHCKPFDPADFNIITDLTEYKK